MKCNVHRLLIITICMVIGISIAGASSDEANVFFNAGTEKYLQGNFTEAVNNLEKAQTLDPNNGRIKDFMVKILLEAATQNHLIRNYRQALIYLEKANKIAPDNAKVQEMYKMTQALVNPIEEKTVKNDQNARGAISEENKPAEKLADVIEARKARKQTDALQQTEKRIQTLIENQKKEPKKSFIMQIVGEMKESYIIFFVFWTIIASVVSFVLFVAAFVKYKEAEAYRRRLEPLEAELKAAVEEKNNMNIELEKTKERYKFEHQAVEAMQKEITESKKHDEKRFKAELDLKTNEIEQRIRSEMQTKYRVSDGQKENFIQHQEERFMKYVSDTSGPEVEADPVLASARERIALMAQNLYEYAPSAAVDFITKMATNPNPLVRTNIVQALANIARPETFELLFELYNDVDLRVKREVLRNLKMLNQKANSGAISLDIVITEKIKSLIDKEKGRGEWIF